MKIILFRSNNIFDSRVNKYHNYYERANIDYTIVGWDRKGEGLNRPHYDFFQYRAGEAVGGLKAIRNHFKWMSFVYSYLKKNRDVTTIHACDLNSAFPAALFKTLYKRDVTLIFDACDWFSANFADKKFLYICFGLMERFTCRKADELIICEPERIEQIQFNLSKQPLVLRNIPEIDEKQINIDTNHRLFNNNNPIIAYVGGFTSSRFLAELLTLSETEPFNLLIAGYGDSAIMQKCNEVSQRDNVKYFGRVNMIECLNIENSADIIYAMYCKVNPNHIYAAPNKYYEALFLGKPLITTKGTIPGNNVEQYGNGWAIEENIYALRKLISNLKPDDISDRGKRAHTLWEKYFKNHVNDFFENTYSQIIK